MPENPVPERYVEVDIETTGLDPHGGDLLLEIQVFVSEPVYPYRRVDTHGFHAIIRQDRDAAYAQANDYVRRMHERTGLWDKLESGRDISVVDALLLAYLQELVPQRQGRVAGNSVRLDMAFIDRFLPLTAAWLHYRILDISAIAYWAHQEFGVPYFEKRGTHTATDDINESMTELRHITEALQAKPAAVEYGVTHVDPTRPVSVRESLDEARTSQAFYDGLIADRRRERHERGQTRPVPSSQILVRTPGVEPGPWAHLDDDAREGER